MQRNSDGQTESALDLIVMMPVPCISYEAYNYNPNVSVLLFSLGLLIYKGVAQPKTGDKL